MAQQLRRVIGNLAVCERLSFRLAGLLSCAKLRLSAGGAIHYLPPSAPDAAVHYSVGIRPPAHLVPSVAPALARLREISPHHHYYTPNSMHVTVAVGSVRRSLGDGSNAAARHAELRALIGSYPSFDLTLRGLSVSPGTVFAQVIPQSGTLRALRKDLRSLDLRAGGTSGFGDYVRDLLPHMNIVRFSGRVTADFLDVVARYRHEWFGRWTVREVEVLWTDASLPRERRQFLERIPLAPIHPRSA